MVLVDGDMAQVDYDVNSLHVERSKAMALSGVHLYKLYSH
jgi:hypothetical protein